MKRPDPKSLIAALAILFAGCGRTPEPAPVPAVRAPGVPTPAGSPTLVTSVLPSGTSIAIKALDANGAETPLQAFASAADPYGNPASIAYRKNGGSPVNLPASGAIWDADHKQSPLIVWPITDTIASTDVITISVPANCLGTAAGMMPAITDQAVANAVPGPHTMRVGYNLMPPGAGALPMYANAAKDRATLIYGGGGQSPALTADGYPQYTTADASWYLPFGCAAANPVDPRGFPGWPLTGTTSILWDGATGVYPSPQPSAGTKMAFVSVRSGQASGNVMQVAFALDGSNKTVAPTWTLRFDGLLDFADDADTGRFATTGAWTTQGSTGAWNGGNHRNDKVATSKATWSLGSLPAGTWFLAPSWVQDAGNTKAASYVVKEAGATIKAFTRDQTGASAGTPAPDLNGNSIGFGSSTTFVCSGGPVTVELTGGTDGFCIADCLFIKAVGSIASRTPIAPLTNLRVYDPTIDPTNTPKFHPNFLKALSGTAYNRSMQLQGAIASAQSSFADYATQTQLCYGGGARTFRYAVTKVESYSNPNGFFPANQGCALFTVAAVNGAPLPLVHGQPFTMPDNLVATFADGSGTIVFTDANGCVEYDPLHMASNQFAMSRATNGKPGPITTLLPKSSAVDLGQGQTAYVSIPWDDYFQLQAPSRTCWPNLTPITTQACVNSIADSYMANMPVGSTCLLEIGNEPFTGLSGYPYAVLYQSIGLQLGVNQMQGYAKLATDRHNWFYARLQTQGRQGELRRVFNCLLADAGTFNSVCAYLDAHNLATPQDVFAVAPYIGTEPVNQTTQVSLVTGLTAAQLADNADAQWSLSTAAFQAELANYQAMITARTKAGKPCALAGYEGGIAWLYLGGNQATAQAQSLSTRYTPELYRSQLGVLATFQSRGFLTFQHYNLTQPPTTDGGPFATQDYGVFQAFSPLIGIGDGSDGLHDNRPDIAGAPPSAPNLLLDVSPIAAAIQTWNAR